MNDQRYNPNAMYNRNAQLQPGTGSAEASIIAEYHKETALIQERTNADIFKYQIKRQEDEDHIIRVMKARADIRMKQNGMAAVLEILPDGTVASKVEFFLEASKSFVWANFKITEKPILYFTNAKIHNILEMKAVTEKQEIKAVYFDLQQCDASYYKRQLRNQGLNLKKSKKKEDIFELIQQLCEIARRVELPEMRGFFMDSNQIFCYAGKEDLIWEEVAKYAGE